MADEAERGATLPDLVVQARARLAARLPLLTLVGLVLALLVLAVQLAVVPALAAFAAIGVGALLLPAAGEAASGRLAASAAGATASSGAVRRFADALSDPCIVLDGRGVVLHRNPAAARQFPGVAEGGVLGFALRFPALLNAVETARNGTAQTVELHQTVPTEAWYRVVIAPLAAVAPDGDALTIVTMQSLTEEKRLERLRSDFIANASHELRTPLTSLVGFIDTLLGPAANDAEARQRFLGMMRGQAARMSKLIEDLLSLSRIEMRQHVRPAGRVELGGLAREVTEGLGPIAATAGVRLTVAAPNEPLVVTGDRDELFEVVENLVDNAIKYGAGGGSVEVEVRAAGKPGFDASVTVIDHGAGVAAEHVPRLTERFYRVDAESSRKKKGTGLGLAIVKHIVNRHHGQLTIRSQPGQGTRVEVLLRK